MASQDVETITDTILFKWESGDEKSIYRLTSDSGFNPKCLELLNKKTGMLDEQIDLTDPNVCSLVRQATAYAPPLVIDMLRPYCGLEEDIWEIESNNGLCLFDDFVSNGDGAYFDKYDCEDEIWCKYGTIFDIDALITYRFTPEDYKSINSQSAEQLPWDEVHVDSIEFKS